MKEKTAEAIKLAEEILENIELDEIPLKNVVLKCTRLARLLDKADALRFFQYEIAGYPKDDKGHILSDAFQLASYGNRTYKQKDKSGKVNDYMFIETVAALEGELEAAKEQMKVAFDRDVSIQSANPRQYVYSPIGNTIERDRLKEIITEKAGKIDKLKASYYKFALDILHQLKFAHLAEEIFSKRKSAVDKMLNEIAPNSLQKLLSAYENLQSKNDEDWANAVHSCRRLIKDIADQLFPPSNDVLKLPDGRTIKFDDEHYIIRLKEYIKSKSSSEKFKLVVGSHLDYIGDRLDALYRSASKGTHARVSQEEAERYVIYTYLLISDILSL